MKRTVTPEYEKFLSKFGDRLRILRRSRSLTQMYIHERTGISGNNLSRIENGRMEPGVWTVRRIARALGVPMKDIFTKEIG